MKKKYWTQEEKKILQGLVDKIIQEEGPVKISELVAKIQSQEQFKDRSSFSVEKALKRYTNWLDIFEKEKKNRTAKEAETLRILQLEKELIRAKTEQKQTEKRYKTLLKESAFEELIKKQIQNIAALSPVKTEVVSLRSIKKIHESAVLPISDIHFAEKVSAEETQGLGGYGVGIALDRLQTIQDRVIDISYRILSEAYIFDELWVLGLGDWVSGYIHPDLFRTAELPIVEQSYVLALVLAQMIQSFAQVFPVVHVRVLSGNHPRLQKEVYSKEKWVGWDYVTGLFLKTLLQNQKNVEVIPLKSFIDFVNIKGYNFALLHGDEIKMGGVMPYYGITRAMYRLESIEGAKFRSELRKIQNGKQAKSEISAEEIFKSAKYLADYTVMGHFHESSTLLSENIIINGSVIGPNEYSLGKGLGGPPMQLFFGVHPEKGKTWQFTLKLDRPVKSRFQIPSELDLDL
ncbi:MAG: hypothetical protein BWY03_00229 [Parcubacteria group bacterium ADurb.Bin159]|jgi:hypothetical protein|nr:MAG: hypothetical protein BWY03_00229 [Parcubacteria group bacterium ADurb.Bin159]